LDVGLGTVNIFRSICNPVWLCQTFGMSGWVWTPKPDMPLQDSVY